MQEYPYNAALRLVTPHFSEVNVGIDQLCREMKLRHILTKSYRKTGAAFGVTGGMAYRIINEGYEPRSARIRARLGLPALVAVPPCPACGGDPCYCADCATPRKRSKPRSYRRVAVRLDDAQRAAETLLTHASAEFCAELAGMLSGNGG